LISIQGVYRGEISRRLYDIKQAHLLEQEKYLLNQRIRIQNQHLIINKTQKNSIMEHFNIGMALEDKAH
jgi:hypothetical protein